MNQSNQKQKIMEMKRLKNICILAHVYQTPDILDVADITGDSFLLAQKAREVDADTVLVCGVSFMADTVKILSPKKKVILAEPSAGCPMAGQIHPSRVVEFRRQHPEYCVAAYVNTSTELKAVSDVCVTSSSAVRILSKIPQNDVLFIPDRNLGAYVAKHLPEKRFLLWEGCCEVHDSVARGDILSLKAKHPRARVAAHPECRPEVLELADMIGATTQIRDHVLETPGEFIIVTERGVVDYLTKATGENRFYQAVPDKLVCEDMKKTTLDSVEKALDGRGGLEITLPEELRLKALNSIEKMLELGAD